METDKCRAVRGQVCESFNPVLDRGSRRACWTKVAVSMPEATVLQSPYEATVLRSPHTYLHGLPPFINPHHVLLGTRLQIALNDT